MKFQFLHIEKTAGMSLHAMLHRDHFAYLSPDPRRTWDPDIQPWILRNFSVGGHNIKRSDRFKYQFTIMRDPVARYISHYNWRKKMMGESWSFDEFLKIDEFMNFQSKKMRCYTGKHIDKDVLESFSLVGIFEEFDNTIGHLCDLLNLWPVTVKENQKHYDNPLTSSQLSESQLKSCRINNSLDQQLYDAAFKLFKAKAPPANSALRYEKLGALSKFKQKSFNVLTHARRTPRKSNK